MAISSTKKAGLSLVNTDKFKSVNSLSRLTDGVFTDSALQGSSLLSAMLAVSNLGNINPVDKNNLVIGNATISSTYSLTVKSGNQTVSSFSNTDWFTTTTDIPALIVVNGNLTINSGQTFIPTQRKLFIALLVRGTLTVTGTLSMTNRGAIVSSDLIRNFLLAKGTYSTITDPQVLPAGNGGRGGGEIQAGGGGGGRAGNGQIYSGGAGGGGGGQGNFGNQTGGAGSDFGGAGGAAAGTDAAPNGAGGGAGNPGGSGNNSGTAGSTGTGGTIIIFANTLANTGTISSGGAGGGNGNAGNSNGAGGGSGGGSANIICGSNSGNNPSVPGGGAGGGNSTRHAGAGATGNFRILTGLETI